MDDIKLKKIIINRSNYTDEYLIDILENLDDLTLASTYISKYTDELFVSKIINNKVIYNKLERVDYISLMTSLNDNEKIQELMNERALLKLGAYGILVVIRNIKDDTLKVMCLKNEKLINMLEEEIVMSIIDSISKQNLYLINEKIIFKKISGSSIASFLNKYNTAFERKNCLIQMIDKQKINFAKLIYIIRSTAIDSILKLEILSTFYPEKKEYIANKTLEEIILMIEKDSINSLKQVKPTETLEYIKIDLIDSKTMEKNIDDIMKIILSNDNVSKELPKWFFEIILCAFSNKISLSNNNDVKCVVLSLDGAMGRYNSDTRTIKLGLGEIKTTMFENIESIITIFHENAHAVQDDKLKKLNYDYDLLRFAKDNVLNEIDTQYGDYEDNYQLCSYESDARARSYVDTYKYLKKTNMDLAVRIFDSNYQSYVEDVRIRKAINRSDIKGNRYTLEELFDRLVPKDVIEYYVKKYPVLSLEYDDAGYKRDIRTIQQEYLYSANELEHLTINTADYKETLKKICILSFFN